MARVRGAHGTSGELAVELLGGEPGRLRPGLELRVGAETVRLRSVRGQGERLICALDGVEDRARAARLTGCYLEVERTQVRPLPQGEYFHYQLVGLHVRDRQGRSRGEVVSVETYPAHDVYVLRSGDKELRVPAVRQAVVEIDTIKGQITVADGYLEGWVDAL